MAKNFTLNFVSVFITRTLKIFLLLLVINSVPISATDGRLGTSSSASSQITLVILPKSDLNKPLVNLSDKNQLSICNDQMQNGLFHFSASGSGESGAFTLTNQSNEKINYRLTYKNKKNEIVNIIPFRSENESQNKIMVNCLDDRDDKLNVVLVDKNNLHLNKIFTGLLTLQISVE